MSLFAAPSIASSLNRRQSLRWAGAAVVGVAGLPGLVAEIELLTQIALVLRSEPTASQQVLPQQRAGQCAAAQQSQLRYRSCDH